MAPGLIVKYDVLLGFDSTKGWAINLLLLLRLMGDVLPRLVCEPDRVGEVLSMDLHGVARRLSQLSDSDDSSNEPEPVIVSAFPGISKLSMIFHLSQQASAEFVVSTPNYLESGRYRSSPFSSRSQWYLPRCRHCSNRSHRCRNPTRTALHG